MSKQYGFGIIGCGLVSDFHGRGIADIDNARVVAATDFDASRAAEFVGKYGGEVAGSSEAICASPDIDIVTVLTPNAYHAEHVIRAAQSGKHVIVEKPPEMSLEKTDAMIAACREENVKLGVSLQVRLRTAIQTMKAAVDSGRFGKLLAAEAYMKWHRATDYYLSDEWRSKRDEGAGVTIQHAFHYLDLILHLAGPASSVRAWMTNLVHPEVELEDTLTAMLDFECGAQGLVRASTAMYPGTDVRIELNGENGTAIMVGEKMVQWEFKDEQPEDEEIRNIGSEAQATAATGAAAFGHLEHRALIQDMIDAINDDREPYVSCPSARQTLATALALYESSDRDETVEVPR
ncbi:MAG TPA: Gfo/Idh/MocA family oxidoreductase [Armatimonadota bacterium]|nr:Gfo/Idh/MocA family oxidoreductase [Armatimonadota bacterium]